MDPTKVEIILKFYVDNLPEDKLAELDALIDGDTAQVAQDAATKPPERRSWLAMDSHRRHAVRQAKRGAREQAARNTASFDARFPNMDRLR